jgi:CO/xanthine dehydrogenase FAD-binding subunit
MIIKRAILLSILAIPPITGCASSPQAVIFEAPSAVQQRSYQSRVFETTDTKQTLRSVIATLQDLGFVMDQADLALGSVSATKLDDYELRVTVTARPRGTTQTLVRASAAYRQGVVTTPVTYQDFFVALEKAMFLTAQQVD